MTLEYLSKILSIAGVTLLVLSISPSKQQNDPNDRWLLQQIKWVKKYIREAAGFSSTVDVNPFLLYLGLALSIIGIALS